MIIADWPIRAQPKSHLGTLRKSQRVLHDMPKYLAVISILVWPSKSCRLGDCREALSLGGHARKVCGA
ncbi:hypothetical protein [Acidiphilium sp.]|nr:hypothetical protein [Acidiphilium sp.]